MPCISLQHHAHFAQPSDPMVPVGPGAASVGPVWLWVWGPRGGSRGGGRARAETGGEGSGSTGGGGQGGGEIRAVLGGDGVDDLESAERRV